ncbi:hypothetical protein EVAR_53676_1 [Eumeta japonica]|uniref:Uncharacterized protein n=1 Tax=Eumeta variegata TaxID=151549 RepID=A0A4C1YKU1_EUMVA|nr:hypothetical protein EVAR_53676_1 [Eumeta japonica]
MFYYELAPARGSVCVDVDLIRSYFTPSSLSLSMNHDSSRGPALNPSPLSPCAHCSMSRTIALLPHVAAVIALVFMVEVEGARVAKAVLMMQVALCHSGRRSGRRLRNQLLRSADRLIWWLEFRSLAY